MADIFSKLAKEGIVKSYMGKNNIVEVTKTNNTYTRGEAWAKIAEKLADKNPALAKKFAAKVEAHEVSHTMQQSQVKVEATNNSSNNNVVVSNNAVKEETPLVEVKPEPTIPTTPVEYKQYQDATVEEEGEFDEEGEA